MKKINNLIKIILSILLINPSNIYALTKTESVYSTMNYDGTIKNTVINNKLSNIEKGDIIDYSKLENIENINGKEKFSRDNEKLVWKSTGKDIVYQGKINNELPIKVNVKYYLNNKEVKPKDIIGKKGSIKIIYKLSNNSYDYNTSLYTPFVVTMISIMNSENNYNFNITNGKVINNGKKTFIGAISSPGLYNNIKIDELRDLDTITLSYDTDSFENSDTYFISTPKLLEQADISRLDDLKNINGSLNTLQNGMNELENGSKTLSNGLESAYNGSNTLNSGVEELSNGLEELNKGIKNALDGSSKITDGLNELNNNTNKFSSLIILVDKLYETYNKNNELLNNILNGTTEQQLKAGIQDATNKKTELENQLVEVNTNINNLELLEQNNQITEEQSNTLQTLRGVKQQLEEGIKQYATGISEAQANLNSLPQAAAKITGANEVIKEVLCGILGVDSMDYVNEQTINMFKEQINKLLNGINELSNGSSNLTNGLNQIYEGSNKLTEGSKKLYGGTNELKDGLNKLYNGSNDLYNGISKVNKEGINKITNYGNDISNYSTKLEQLTNLSKNYKGFSNNNSDEVIFIYKISK